MTVTVVPTPDKEERRRNAVRPLWENLLKIEARIAKLANPRGDSQLNEVLALEFQAAQLKVHLARAFKKTLSEFDNFVRPLLEELFGSTLEVEAQTAQTTTLEAREERFDPSPRAPLQFPLSNFPLNLIQYLPLWI